MKAPIKGIAGRVAIAAAAAIALIATVAAGCVRILPPPAFDDAAWTRDSDALPRDTLYAPHERDGRFFNPWRPDERGFSTVLRWRLSTHSRTYPNPVPPVDVVPNDGAYLARQGEPASITWIGHATFAIHTDDQVWVTDPMFSDRALLPKRAIAPGLPTSAIPEGAFALISHNHYDHLDVDSVRSLPASTRWFVPRGLGEYVRRAGATRVDEMDWWDRAQVGASVLVCLPAQHWSNRVDMGRNRSLWAAWLLITPTRRIYFGGDSGYFHGFAEIGERFGPIDDAILPIGAYEPRWFMAKHHLNIDESLRAFEQLRAKRMIPMQFGVFKLGDEPSGFPLLELRNALAARPDMADKVHIPAVGERLMLDQEPG
jgi:L-ascorbate metabolism protein UlaG (beta-lactamase superfamily)